MIDEPPLSLWGYLANGPIQFKSCIGRNWELSQLQKLQMQSRTSLQIAYIYGMQGLGKTTLVRHFLSRMEQSHRRTLYLCGLNQNTFLRRFICTLLDTSEMCDDERLRSQIKAIAKSSLVYFYLLQLSGTELNKPESKALNSLSKTRLYEVEVLSVMVLIQNLKQRAVSVIAIDGLHHLEERQLRVMQIFTKNMMIQPVLIIFALTDVFRFTYLPDWLHSSHPIQLKSLQPDSMDALANAEVNTKHLQPMADDTHKKMAVQRAKGNPSVLKALIKSKRPALDFPEEFFNNVQTMSTHLTEIEYRLLQFLAASGPSVSTDIIESFTSKLSKPSITLLHKLVRVGFLYPRSEAYIFRHTLIWEIVKSQMSDSNNNLVYPDHKCRLQA
nr:ATP-binding protein [Shewanella abyssi]